MYYTVIRDRIRQQRLLHSVMLELTYRCDLDCFFCYNDHDARGTPLALEQYFALFDDLARMQVMFLTFTGGEPMVHPHFFAIGRAARDSGFVVRVRTNGHRLRTPVARRLKRDVDPFMVEISLHGACAATHDRQTQVAGSFDRLVGNVQACLDAGLRVGLISTLTLWNQHEIEAMYELADHLGVQLRWQGPVGPRDNGDTTPMTIQPPREAWERYQDIVRRRIDVHEPAAPADDPAAGLGEPPPVAERDHLCGVGAEGVDIDPFGNVYPCMHLRWSAGSLHDRSIEEIWLHSGDVFSRARELSEQAAQRFAGRRPEQLGAPLFCPAVDLVCCGSGSCEGSGIAGPRPDPNAQG